MSRRGPDRSRALAEVEALAWLLDNSIPVPGTGGRRFGIDAIIGLVPGVGDVAAGVIGLYVVWRGARLGLPGIVLARMLANVALDAAVGIVPIAGDAFDLWYKSTTRNLALMRRHLADPSASTRDEWLFVLGLLAVVVGVILLAGWLVVSLLGALVDLLS